MGKNIPRRHFLQLASGAAALPAVSRIAWAQAYPTRRLPEDMIAHIYGPQPKGTYIGTYPYVKETPQYHVVKDQTGKSKWFEKAKHVITHLPDGKVDVHGKPLGLPTDSTP
jgi:hypothetical protein